MKEDFAINTTEDEDDGLGLGASLDAYGLPVLPIEKSLGPYVVKLSHISKSYQLSGRSDDDAVVALHDVHMDVDSEVYPIRKGEFVMLRGPSGGGKTSLLNILGTIDSPTSGELEILGHVVTSQVSFSFLTISLSPITKAQLF